MKRTGKLVLMFCGALLLSALLSACAGGSGSGGGTKSWAVGRQGGRPTLVLDAGSGHQPRAARYM